VLGQGGEPAVGPRWGVISHHQGVVLVGAGVLSRRPPLPRPKSVYGHGGGPRRHSRHQHHRLAASWALVTSRVISAAGVSVRPSSRGRGHLTGAGGQFLGPAARSAGGGRAGDGGTPPQQVGVDDDPDQPSPSGGRWWMSRSTMASITSPVVLSAGRVCSGVVMTWRTGVSDQATASCGRGVGGGHQAGRPAVDISDTSRSRRAAGRQCRPGAGDDRPAGQLRLGPRADLVAPSSAPAGPGADRTADVEWHPGDLLHGHSIAPSGRAGPVAPISVRPYGTGWPPGIDAGGALQRAPDVRTIVLMSTAQVPEKAVELAKRLATATNDGSWSPTSPSCCPPLQTCGLDYEADRRSSSSPRDMWPSWRRRDQARRAS
jgi:hypothetical protein